MTRAALLRTLLATAALGAAIWAGVALTSREGAWVFDGTWPVRVLGGELSAAAGSLLLEVRLPRVIAALLVGACLALAGLVLQGISRNPLADPYLLGVSGGAGLAVVLLHALPALVQSAGFWLVPTAAFVGAQAAALIVLLLARGGAGRITTLGLILAGIAVNAFCAALMAFVLARFDPFRVRVTTLWLAGGIGYPAREQLLLSALLTLGCWIYLRAQAHRLNALALGASGAAAVGVDTDRLLHRAALTASLLTGIAVAAGGLLGFVGLIVPHAARLLVGADLRSSIPASAALGSLLLVVADTGARILFAPEELPVGVLTALIGCPVLILLLRAQLRGVKR